MRAKLAKSNTVVVFFDGFGIEFYYDNLSSKEKL